MDMNIDEQWLELDRNGKNVLAIVRISNTGKYQRENGEIGTLKIRSRIAIDGKLIVCSRIIASAFLVTVKRPDQVFIDHITHNPTDYNVNDVRNLRWCTHKENMNFEEAREHFSNATSGTNNPRFGKPSSMRGKYEDLHPGWKGESASEHAKYCRERRSHLRDKKSRQ